MKLSEISTTLQDISARYGGAEEYVRIAVDLDRAVEAFLREQDIFTLTRLNGAVARAEKIRKFIKAEKGGLETA